MSTTSIASKRTGEEYFNRGVRTARRAAGFGGLEQLYDRHHAAFGYPADQLKRATIGALRDRVSWQSSLDALMRAVEIDPEEIEWQRWTALVLEELGRFDHALLVRRTIASIDPGSLENIFAFGRLLERKGEPVQEYYAQALTDSSDYLLALARGAAFGSIVIEPDTLENDFALGRMLERKGEPGPQVLAGESDYLLVLARAAAFSAPTVIERSSIEKNFAVGRLLERKGETVHRYYARVLTSSSDYSRGLSRGAASPIVSEHIVRLHLKDRVRGALIVSPGNVALHLAMGFIGIAEHDDATTRASFLTALMLAQQPGPKEGCDPWSLAFAQAFLRDPSEHTTQLGLKDCIRGALTLSPTNVALHLAMGFMGIAERDEATTQTSFLTALVLAEQPEPKRGCDPWSLGFAQAFLLDQSDIGTSGLILPSDPIRLALARAAALRSHGAIMPAVRDCAAAASQLLVQKPPRAYRIYKGYKVVFFKNQFYGVPKDIRDFSILRGYVVGVPDVDEGSGSRGLRSLFAAMLSDMQRTRLKYRLRIARPHVQFTAEASRVALRALGQALRDAIRAPQALRVAIRAPGQALRVAIRVPGQALRIAIRGLRLAMKTLRRLAGEIYFRRHIVGGVLVDSDAVQLQQRIDALKQAPPDVTASTRTSATG
jgi:hypothetical protein